MPTAKQKKAIGYLAANPKATVSEAMREAGYSESTIDHPTQNFVGLPGVQSAAEEFRAYANEKLGNHLIVSKINELLEAEKIDHSHTEPDHVMPDYQARAKGIEFSLKVRGLGESVGGNQTNVQVNFGGLKDQYKKGGE
jgi:hypothetical protein